VTSRKLKLALFDLDHTLLPIDSDYSWGVFTTDIGWTDPHAFRQKNDEFFAHYQAGTLDIHDYVRFATEAVRLQGAEKAAEAHARFMRDVVGPQLRPEAQALVRQHQQAGDQVVIVTATNEFVKDGKVARVADWLAARRLDWQDVEMSFYSDSMNDLPLLEKAQRPVATNPDSRLRALAQQRGWRILDLFPSHS